MKKLLYGAVALAISLSASAQPMERDGRGSPFMKTLKQLELNEQQKADVKLIIKQARSDQALFQQERRDARKSMQAVIRAEEWDAAVAQQILDENADLHQQARLQQALTRHNIWLLLDDSQKQTLSDLDGRGNERKARMQERRESMWQRVTEKLALSDQQQSDIATIRQQRMEASDAFRTLAKAHREAERDLIRSATFDQVAWQSLYQQHQDAAQSQALAMAYSKHQVMQVLTEEQRELFANAEKKAQKRFKQRRQGF